MSIRSAVVLPLLLFLALSVGCGPEEEEPGVVARVNGDPIYLSRLEFKNDLLHFYRQSEYNPSVEQLRSEYGQALADLIVQKLIEQDLQSRGLEVTDQELREAEQEVRDDYPEGAFEEVLVEEYIDLGAWRQQLRARLAMEKLNNLVLRPQVKLDYVEAEQYYRENIQDFYLPPRVVVVLVEGPSRELVKKAGDYHDEGESPDSIEAKLKQTRLRRIKLREDRLSAGWGDALEGVEPGGKSSVWEENDTFNQLLLLERIPGKVLDPSQAYPLVEKVLLERKLWKAFDEWLANALGQAEIKVSKRLLEERATPDTNENEHGSSEG
ncbi:SurA N-terminal domain-containing protein [Desulfohalovibrio reitneri]|uniref:SurA N-terminal domain-containing protein n=1 Tax=Desulfohalovibrio reitneri TaxID=1307759 RepID=UPI00068B2518|nr:SurA N-terminal domain-containing protein [Desulfohalovibrio reitneri]